MFYIMHVADEDEKQHGSSCDMGGQLVAMVTIYTLTFGDCIQALQGSGRWKNTRIVHRKLF